MKSIKKAFAFLLALLLLTGCVSSAVAEEGHIFSLTFEVDEEQMAAYDRDLGGDGKIGKAIAELLNKLSVTGSGTDQEMAYFVKAEDTVLLDFAEKIAEDGTVLLASSILPNLIIDVSTLYNQAAEKSLLGCLTDAFNQISMQQANLQKEIEDWAASFERTTETGQFAGDAYTGGQNRYTIRCTDRDFAFLLIRLLDKLEGIEEALAPCGIDWNEIKADLIYDFTKIAIRNENHYILRSVTDAQNQPVGFSLTALRGEEQILTLSIGIDYENLSNKVIVGFGYENQVYMLDIEVEGLSVTDSVSMSGSVKLWQDPYREGYRAAVTDENNLLGTLTLNRLTAVKALETTTLVYDANLSIPGKKGLRETGRWSIGPTIQCSSNIYYDGADTPMLTVKVSTSTGEIEHYTWPQGKTVTITDENVFDMFVEDNTIQQALNQGLASLGLRLFEVIPLDLLTVLLPLFQ